MRLDITQKREGVLAEIAGDVPMDEAVLAGKTSVRVGCVDLQKVIAYSVVL